MAAAEGIVLGRYVLGPLIARGGMGEVFHATQQGMGQFAKPLVLKLLLPHLGDDPLSVQLFLEEARLASRMNHPNVVSILDVGVSGGRYFIAMELVRGTSLAAMIDALNDTRTQLPPGVLYHLARGLAEALHHAHEQVDAKGVPLGLVHRDVSPQNLLVSVDGVVKLTDFGIAKARDSLASTRPGFVRGKVEYLSPEQALTRKIDRRADLFAAATTLFHAATRVSPFRGANEAETARAVVSEPFPLLSEYRPDLADLSAVLQRAAAKDPDSRYATARELRDALPKPPVEAADQLAALMVKLCPEAVGTIDRAVETTKKKAAMTADVRDEAQAPPRPRPSSSSSRPPGERAGDRRAGGARPERAHRAGAARA